MTFSSLFNDLIVLFAFLLIGFVIREIFKPLQRIYIPASIIGGVIALIVGPQVLGLVSIPGIWDYRQYLCGHDHVDLGCSFMFRGGYGYNQYRCAQRLGNPGLQRF